MSKKKSAGRPTPPRRLLEKLDQALALIEADHPQEALAILTRLDQDFPNQPDILASLMNAYVDLGDSSGYEYAVRRLTKLEPQNADLALAAAGALRDNDRFALSLFAFRDALRRWPGHPRAAQVREQISLLERSMPPLVQETGLPLDQALDVMAQHDELRYCLDHSLFSQARQVADKLLSSYPDFVPAMNNLVSIYAVQGDFPPAIDLSRRVLELEPDNIHALSNLVRLHFLSGHPDDASRYAARLKASTAEAFGRWTKIAEALSFLGDDQGVLALYDRARQAGELEPPRADGLFYHLLGVAACRLGDVKKARRYWQKALKLAPSLEWAQANLDDLDQPQGRRSGPWAYPFENWLQNKTIQELLGALDRRGNRAKIPSARQSMARFVEQHPVLLFLAPHLLERGDAKARQFVFTLAAATAHPQLVELTKAFIFGKQGSADQRAQGIRILSEADLLPPGPVKIWTGSEWSNSIILNFEITSQMTKSGLSRKEQALFEQAHQELIERNGRRAQELLEQVLAAHGDEPSVLFNLATAYQMQGLTEKGEDLVRQVHRRFPDYFFGAAAVARMAISAGDLEQARQLLDELMQRKRMHTSEFNIFCIAQIEISLADGKPEVARIWLDMMEKVDPDNPNLFTLRRSIEKSPRKK